MDKPKKISVSRALSAYLAALLRGQGFGITLKNNAVMIYDGEALQQEEETIRLWEEGLDNDRLELHGLFTSSAIANIVCHNQDFAGQDLISYRDYLDDLYKFGKAVDIALWKGILPEKLMEVEKELIAFGEFSKELYLTIKRSRQPES